MDRLSLFGALLALAAIFGGNYIEGGEVDTLINGAAAVIVFGGTLGAGLLQTSARDIRRAFDIFPWVFTPVRLNIVAGFFLSRGAVVVSPPALHLQPCFR